MLSNKITFKMQKLFIYFELIKVFFIELVNSWNSSLLLRCRRTRQISGKHHWIKSKKQNWNGGNFLLIKVLFLIIWNQWVFLSSRKRTTIWRITFGGIMVSFSSITFSKLCLKLNPFASLVASCYRMFQTVY